MWETKRKRKKRVYTRNDILVRRFFFLEIMAIIKVCYERDTGNECLKNSDQRNQIASEFFSKILQEFQNYRPIRNETPLRPPDFFFFPPSSDSMLSRLSSSTETPLICSQAAFSWKKNISMISLSDCTTSLRILFSPILVTSLLNLSKLKVKIDKHFFGQISFSPARN